MKRKSQKTNQNRKHKIQKIALIKAHINPEEIKILFLDFQLNTITRIPNRKFAKQIA